MNKKDSESVTDEQLLLRIGNTLREKRLKLGIKQQVLSDRVGLPCANSLWYIENGKRKNLSILHLRNLCKELGININQFF